MAAIVPSQTHYGRYRVAPRELAGQQKLQT
jgi:hypothetical protein